MRALPDQRESSSPSQRTVGFYDADRRIARAIRICVGNHVREMYSDVVKEPIPPGIADLLRRLD